MKIRNVLRIALVAIRRNAVRSGLTMLGVIIGVASVIAMIALGSGARAAIDDQIQQQGTNVIYVSAGSFGRGPGMARGGAGSTTTLTLEDAQAIARDVPTIARVSPMARGRAQVVAGNQNWNTSVEGGNEDYIVIRNWPLASGADFTARDVLVAEKVALLGPTVAKTLFPDSDPVGQIIRVRNLPFRVVGVLTSKGQNQWGQDQDDIIIAPYTTVQKKLLGITFIQQIVLSATSSDAVEPAAVEITKLMRQRHKIQDPNDDDFTVRTVAEMAATRTEMANTMTMLLMSVASVSLLVGGIGIMNIMLVSVTERTREIGLRMAVGARTRDILRQFLAEAVSLSIVGGAVGVLLGMSVSRLLTTGLGWPTVITPTSIIVAFAFAGAVGVFFGFYPARKAAELDPIEALRYE
ncbi:MAG: multidrug ABC transporter substrate-binding protein [Acidobacteria bacterium]|nr:MAG: multidrug ABC transporter substrate-binding protein [Acidobacteriota bacterium]